MKGILLLRRILAVWLVVMCVVPFLTVLFDIPSVEGAVSLSKTVALREIYGVNHVDEIVELQTEFAQGEVSSVNHIRLWNSASDEVPFSAFPRNIYGDGSLRQVQVYWLANLTASQTKTYTLDVDSGRSAPSYSTDFQMTEYADYMILENSKYSLGMWNSTDDHGIRWIYWKTDSVNASEAVTGSNLPWWFTERESGTVIMDLAYSNQEIESSPVVTKFKYRLSNATYNARLDCEIWLFSKQNYFLVQSVVMWTGSSGDHLFQHDISFRWSLSGGSWINNETTFNYVGAYNTDVGFLATPFPVSGHYDFSSKTGRSFASYAFYGRFRTGAFNLRPVETYDKEKWTYRFLVWLDDEGSDEATIRGNAVKCTRRLRAFVVRDILSTVFSSQELMYDVYDYFESRYRYNETGGTLNYEAFPYKYEDGGWLNAYPEDLINHLVDSWHMAIQTRNKTLINRVTLNTDKLVEFYDNLKPWSAAEITPQLQGAYLTSMLAEAYLTLEDYNGTAVSSWKNMVTDLANFIHGYVNQTTYITENPPSKTVWVFNMDGMVAKALYMAYLLNGNTTLRDTAKNMFSKCAEYIKEPFTFAYSATATASVSHEGHYTLWMMHELVELAILMPTTEPWRATLISWGLRNFYFWSNFNNGTFTHWTNPFDKDMNVIFTLMDVETWLQLCASLSYLGYYETHDHIYMALKALQPLQNSNGTIGEFGLVDYYESDGYEGSPSYSAKPLRNHRYGFGRLWHFVRENASAAYSSNPNITPKMRYVRLNRAVQSVVINGLDYSAFDGSVLYLPNKPVTTLSVAFGTPQNPYIQASTETIDGSVWSSEARTLTVTLSASFGITSITEVYCGDEGEPASVSGATIWSYDGETNIVTINILHEGPQEVVLHWIEHNPPTTTLYLSGVEGHQNWFTSNVRVTLFATDDASGVDRMEYSLDNTRWSEYTVPLTITSEGHTTVYYRSIDNDGNKEMVQSKTFKIDKTNPSGGITINNDDPYTSSTSVTLAMHADDRISKVAQMRFSHDNATWTPWETYVTIAPSELQTGDGMKAVYVQFVDHAGLVSQSYFDVITLDTAPPSVTITSPDSYSELSSPLLTLDWNGSDGTSGVRRYEIRLDDGPWIDVGTNTTYTFTVVDEGDHVVEVKAWDFAGLSEKDSVQFAVIEGPSSGQGYREQVVVLAVGIIIAIGLILYIFRIRGR